MPSTRLDQWASPRCCTVSWIVVPVWVKEKLGSADSQALEHWAIVLLEAKTLDDVFK